MFSGGMHRGSNFDKMRNSREKDLFVCDTKTPHWLINKIVDRIFLKYTDCKRLLDPCAGDNRFFRRYLSLVENKVCYSYDIKRDVDSSVIGVNNYVADFLNIKSSGKFEVVFMNPPFNKPKNAVWKFVKRVFDHWLVEDGVVFCIAPNYFIDNGEKRKIWLDQHLSRILFLPKDTFKEYGVNQVHCSLLEMRNIQIEKKFGFMDNTSEQKMLWDLTNSGHDSVISHGAENPVWS